MRNNNTTSPVCRDQTKGDVTTDNYLDRESISHGKEIIGHRARYPLVFSDFQEALDEKTPSGG